MSFVESVFLSEVVALVVCGAAPDAGAADIVEGGGGRDEGRMRFLERSGTWESRGVSSGFDRIRK